jgi:hypothetical protein
MRVPLVCRSGCLALSATFFLFFPPPVFAAEPSDDAAAASVLGPEWKQLSRRAGIIFAGSVLSASSQSAECESPGSSSAADASPKSAPLRVPNRGRACPVSTAVSTSVPTVEFRFRVDRPITGVEPGQVLTIREWTGALSRQRPLRRGDRVLLFLYPPGRLGLTSPVGGAQGQVRLDPSGQFAADQSFVVIGNTMASDTHDRSSSQDARSSPRPISISQLARAIRAARGE